MFLRCLLRLPSCWPASEISCWPASGLSSWPASEPFCWRAPRPSYWPASQYFWSFAKKLKTWVRAILIWPKSRIEFQDKVIQSERCVDYNFNLPQDHRSQKDKAAGSGVRRSSQRPFPEETSYKISHKTVISKISLNSFQRLFWSKQYSLTKLWL